MGLGMADPASESSQPGGAASRLRRPVQVLIVSSVMFTFISYWRVAAVVLCDLASTAYYIGGIVEGAIGPAAPWFILAVMLFSYAVRSMYIESCALFVRGGAYRVVKAAMGGFLAKLSVSALMFDFILTGPTSAVSAGQYIVGLVLDCVAILFPELQAGPETADLVRRWGSMAIAIAITLYFFRQNLLGIHESSGKALQIMALTTVMAVIMLAWCGVTLLVRGPANSVPLAPDLAPKVEYQTVIAKDRVSGQEKPMWNRDPETGRLAPLMERDGSGVLRPKPVINEVLGEQEDPLGLMGRWFPGLAKEIRRPGSWLSLVGLLGILMAFGHSILAMSGEETLAQVYREIQSPKLKNFEKAAFIVFVYSLVLTVGISFLAVLLVPDEIRMKDYSGNLISGLAMHVIGPPLAKLLLNGFVVVVGFLILAGAVNTAIIGSNGVLNRVAEDGVLPDWFLKPHRRYGTTNRLLVLIVGLQLSTILISRGNMYLLGEAYAFGVVWSFVFTAMAMVVLRFKDRTPREFKVPLNLRIGGVELPIGLLAIFLLLLVTALVNLFTKEVATIGGVTFTAVFLAVFMISERVHERRRGSVAHHHVEQFNEQTADEISLPALRLDKPYRKLVAIRSPQNLFMLEKALVETDPETTEVIVMTAHVTGRGDTAAPAHTLDHYERELMTAVVNRAEAIGKHVMPLIISTNNPLFAVVQTADNLQAQELILGASNAYSPDEQIDSISLYWVNIHQGDTRPLTVRILSRDRDIYFDLAGGSRIPTISERRARSVAELRAAGVGIDHVLMVHDGDSESSSLFEGVLTMLDPEVKLTLALLPPDKSQPARRNSIEDDLARAAQLRRSVTVEQLVDEDIEEQIVRLARERQSDLVILVAPEPASVDEKPPLDTTAILRASSCRVCMVSPPAIPVDAEQGGKSSP